MHFTLVLLLCSLISISSKKIERDLRPATEKDLQKGRIVSVEPKDFLGPARRKNSIPHPAVFVDIKDGVARVVVISNSFRDHNVPPHLREDVIVYFGEETKTSALGQGEVDLKGELDLSMYRELEPGRILIANSAEPTFMKQTQFEKMNAKIRFNKANRGISPFVQKGRGCEEHASASLNDGKGESREIKSKELMSAPLKYRKLDLDSIEAGEVVHVLPESMSGRKNTYLAIFVSWTGNASLAIMSIQKNKNAHTTDSKTADIRNYEFSPDREVKSTPGKFVPIDPGVISLDNYQIVPSTSLFPDWNDKRIMEYESYARLREEIDSNIMWATPPGDLRQKRLGSPSSPEPSSTNKRFRGRGT